MVILDDAYGAREGSGLGDLFWDLVRLKIDGYASLYRERVLAVGDSDFIATHKFICEERNGKLIPLLGNHTLTVERATRSNLIFPALALCRAAKAEQHAAYVLSSMERCAREKRNLGYDAGWAGAPETRHDKALTLELHKLFRAIKVFYVRNYGIDELITAGTVRFNVEKSCKFWGYQPIELQGKRLPDIPVPRFDNEMVTMLHMTEMPKAAIDFASQYEEVWQDRIVIEPRSVGCPKKAA